MHTGNSPPLSNFSFCPHPSFRHPPYDAAVPAMHGRNTERGMNDDIGARLGAMNQSRRSVRRARRAPRVVSVGLLVMATAMGVHLGLGGPAVSPVSPAAIAARYGAPPAAAPALSPVVAQVTPRRRQ